MGKTPGKWIKNLLGKKSSKSNSLKKREILKPADKGEPLVSINEPLPELPAELPVSSPPVPDISSRNEVDSEKEIAATLENPEVPLCSGKEGGVAETTVDLAAFGDSQKTRHEQAATQAQAAFRGYLARRAFRTLKGIVKLQALIRGHLVRRQAVATFSCVWGIVKLQALARGQKVRRSDIGIEAHKIYSQGKLLDAKYASTSGLSLSTQAQRFRKNAFIQKLLVVSPTAMPLRLQYGPGESNSANEWLERWTMSHFWEPLPQPKKKNNPKSQTKRSGSGTKETDQSRPKRSIRKPSTPKFENGTTNHSASGSEKRKRNIVKKLPGHTSNPVQEHPSTEKDKIKRNLRKTSDSTKDVSKKSEVDNGKTKQNPRKASASTNPEITVQGTVTSDFAVKVNDMVVTPKQQSDPETSLNLPAAHILVAELHDQSLEENGKTESIQELHDRSVADEKPVEENGKSESIQELHDRSVADEKPVEENGKSESIQELHDRSVADEKPVGGNGTSESIRESDKELNSNDGQINKENPKNSQRRVSLPANTDDQENTLQSTPKLPSYMAPTASAKARLRGQGSPRFSLEVVEKNSATRRLSLTSSNGKLSTPSPQAQKLLQASGKGVVRSDKSLTSSRDGGRSTWS